MRSKFDQQLAALNQELTEMGATEFTTVSTTGTLACAVSAAKAETDSEQSIRTANRRENSFFVLILTLPPSATGMPRAAQS